MQAFADIHGLHAMTNTFFLESLGCAKNQVDSEYIIGLLETHGLTYRDDPQEAACIIVNTCGFIQSAKEESIETILDFRHRFPQKKIILIGCLALRYQRELENTLGETDGIWGDIRDPRFPAYIRDILDSSQRKLAPPGPASLPEAVDFSLRQKLLSFPGSVYIKISEGCGNNCTYCAIPLIRGRLHSRMREEIIKEARIFIARGIREINLIAQDTAAFGTDRGEPELMQLLESLAALDGNCWIRLLYIHPDHFPEHLLDVFASFPHLLPYFDIPFQHASSRILTAMNRRGNADTYMALVDRIRTRLPHSVLRTTFLVGFPGETKEDFDKLVDFQQRITPQWAGFFVYSAEEGTRAAMLPRKVRQKTALERKRVLEEQQISLTHRWLDRLQGLRTDVLTEELVQGENLALGRAWFQAPEVDGLVIFDDTHAVPGHMRRVNIEGRAGMDLRGVTIDE